MTTTQEALKMAIEALQNNQVYDCEGKPMLAIEEANEKAIQACKEALEQQEQEPVATKLVSDPYDEREGIYFSLDDWAKLKELPAGTKLYLHPAKQLSDDEIIKLAEKYLYDKKYNDVTIFARAIEAKIRGE